jgi:hypothetical protein
MHGGKERSVMGDKSPKNTNKAKQQKSQAKQKGMKPAAAPPSKVNVRVKK